MTPKGANVPRVKNIPGSSNPYMVANENSRFYKLQRPEHTNGSQGIGTYIGSPDLTDGFYPHVRVSRWDDDVWMEFRPTVDLGNFADRLTDDGNGGLEFVGNNFEARFYEVTDDELPNFVSDGHGGFEFEIILRQVPPINQISMQVATHNCELWYQPDAATQGPGCYVPDDVVGTYAVYATSQADGKPRAHNKWRTGKLCHILKPKVFDDTGAWIYATFNDDAGSTGVLTITVDPVWLASATYPVRIDPTAGYTSQGASNRGIGTNYNHLGNASGSNDDSTGSLGSDATLSAGHAYLAKGANGNAAKCAIYLDTGTLANDTKLTESSSDSTNSLPWYPTFAVFDWTLSGTMLSGNTYRMGAMSNADPDYEVRIAQDYSASSANADDNVESTYTFPANLSGYGTLDNRCSLYFDYTETGGATRRVMVVS